MRFYLKKSLCIWLSLVCMLISSCSRILPLDTDNITRDFLLAPVGMLDPHEVRTVSGEEIASFCETALVADIHDGIPVWGAATNISDVTNDFEKAEKYGITESEGRVFRIELRKDFLWSNGAQITSASYIESMQSLISPHQHNSASIDFVNGPAALYGSAAYQMSGKSIFVPVVPAYSYSDTLDYTAAQENAPVYISLLSDKMTLCSHTIRDAVVSGDIPAALFERLMTNADADGFLEVTDDNIDDVTALCASFASSLGLIFDDKVYTEMLFYRTEDVHPEVSFDEVGLLAEDDYTLLYITESFCSYDNFIEQMMRMWLVYTPIYDRFSASYNGSVTNGYGSSSASYISCGPYQIDSWDEDVIRLVPNEHWYGYNADESPISNLLEYHIVQNLDEAANLYHAGEIDHMIITDGTLLKQNPEAIPVYTGTIYRFVFASDLDILRTLSTDENNKQILSYHEFRNAFALLIDRAQLCDQTQSMTRPMDRLLVDKVQETAEQDIETARELLHTVFQRAVEDGLWHEGDRCEILCAVTGTSLTDNDRAQEVQLNQWLTEACIGTGFENALSISFVSLNRDRYAAIAAGAIEMIRGGWKTETMDPVEILSLYIDPSAVGGKQNLPESCGWDPTLETLTLELNGETVTKTLTDWCICLQMHEFAAVSEPGLIRALEDAVLSFYQCIPYAAEVQWHIYRK